VLRAADGSSLARIAGRIADLAPSLSDAELRDLACQLGREASAPGGLRLGVVAGDQNQLATQIRQAARLVSALKPGQLAARPGIFAGNQVRGRVVLLFPGLAIGQDSIGHDSIGHDSIGHDSTGHGATSHSATSHSATGHDGGQHASTPPPLFGLTDPEAVEPAILHASLSGLRWLDRLGVTADAAVGHSLGEISGLVWAGALAETEATRLVAQRAAVISASGARQTAMVSVAADAAASKALCAGTDLVIAAYNGPGWHVLAGSVAGVREVTRRAGRQGIRAVVLDVSHAFHSPAMGGCAAPLRCVLSDIRFGPLQRRLVSTVTGREITRAEDIAELLCSALTSPVRFTDALAAAAADADLLCETGPGHALAALAASGCDMPAVSLEARTADDRGAAHAAAALFAAGAVDSLEPVLAGRTAQPVDIWQERIVIPAPAAAGVPAETRASDAPGVSTETSAADVIPISNRAGQPDAAGPALPYWRGRFLQEIRAHRPGSELIADSTVGPDTDPYLADYRIDGEAALPAVIGLEAMAQAAAALAGRPMLQARQVSFGPPAVIRPGTVIRVCAKREGKRVSTVLRSRDNGQWADRCRAVFQARGAEADGAPGQPVTAGGGAWPAAEPATAILDSADLYGAVCFQTGRFRRVAFLPELTSRRCRALIRGGDDQPWFSGSTALAGAPLLLGSPGLNDATLHVLQASFPHRRVLPAGCDAVTVSGRQVRGAVEVRAMQRSASGPHGPGECVWDVAAVDAAGQPVVTWTGLRLRDAGPVPGNPALPPALLGAYLERGATALGLDPALRITVRCEQPPRGPAAAGSAAARRPGWVSARSRGQLDELSLRLRGASPAACAWETADLDSDAPGPDAADPEFAALRQRLAGSLAEPAPTLHARIRTAIECLSEAGRPVGCELVVDGCYDNGWALLHAGDALIACTTVRVIGVSWPVAVSIMTGTGLHAAGAA
jgi:malonyl CoA-acyl carrier protein transacylase